MSKLRVLASATSLALITLLTSQSALAVSSFNAAKNHLPKIYKQLSEEGFTPTTFYCNYPIDIKDEGRKVKWSVDAIGHGYKVRRDEKRAQRIEAEHVMPAYDFGRQLPCWRDGGRKECGKNDHFKAMEGELHNLFPAVGEVNNDRSNFSFTAWNEKGPSSYGTCNVYVDRKNKRFMPSVESRGAIARAYFFMEQKYKIILSRQDRQLFTAWNNQYPPTPLECRRNELIAKVQGYDNPFITEKCKTK